MSYDTPPPIEIDHRSPNAIKSPNKQVAPDAPALCRPESGRSGRTPLTVVPQHAESRSEIADAYGEAYRACFRLWRKWGF